MHLERIISVDRFADVEASAGIAPLEPDAFLAHGPDAHWTARGNDGALRGRCSLWWTDAPPLAGERPGVIGHYAAADGEAAAALLARATAELAGAGCTLAIGPMDGNTWRAYRLVTERGEAPPFFLEPWNPPDAPEQWIRAGFLPQAEYVSGLDAELDRDDPREPRLEESVLARGVVIRRLDAENAERDLRAIHALSLEAFAANHLYTPISEAAFLEQYRKILPAVRPELVLLAEHEERLVGFMFAVPDLLEGHRSGPPRTVIQKSMAVAPGWGGVGLGGLLFCRSRRAARDLGARRAIHALMHEENASRRLSARYGLVFRRYTLFERRLTP